MNRLSLVVILICQIGGLALIWAGNTWSVGKPISEMAAVGCMYVMLGQGVCYGTAITTWLHKKAFIKRDP